MNVTAYRTRLVQARDDLNQVIAEAIPKLPERSILVIASKIVSTCEDRFVTKVTGEIAEKHELVKKEADFYLDASLSRYNLMITIKNNWMWANAGIDESNADNQYILWPADPQRSVNQVWQFLRAHYGLKEVGVTMSDSTSIALNWGVTGHAIAHCGFEPLLSYVGKPDLFGREMKMEKLNIMQSVTAAAVMEMGEGSEQTPLGVVSELHNVTFCDHVPTSAELAELKIDRNDDLFAPLLTAVPWQKGQSGKY